MKYCSSCGKKFKKDSEFCDKCGEKLNKKENNKTKSKTTEKINEVFDNIMDTKDSTKSFNKKDIEKNKIIALVSYLGILVLIPYCGAKESNFVQYHAKQGINLLVVWICYFAFYGLMSLIKVKVPCGYLIGYNIGDFCQITPWWITFLLSIMGIIIIIFVVIGIINVLQGKAKELPIIGNLVLLNKK